MIFIAECTETITYRVEVDANHVETARETLGSCKNINKFGEIMHKSLEIDSIVRVV